MRRTYVSPIFKKNIDLLNGTLVMRRHRTMSKIDSAMESLSVASKLLFQAMRNTLTYLRHERGQGALGRAYTSLVDSIEGRGELVINANLACNTVKIVEEICKVIGRSEPPLFSAIFSVD